MAFPTETVYGLGAIATNDRAVSRIFHAKGRPWQNPLIVHITDRSAAFPLAYWTDTAEVLADAFWPGPLTLVMTRKVSAPISPLATAGLSTIALRVPAATVARDLLQEVMLPVAAPSANPSGRVSPTRAEHVNDGLGEEVDLILDGGPCSVGIESSVVDVSGETPKILRVGGIPVAQIEELVGKVATRGETDAITSPGQLDSHYAPNAQLRLDADTVDGHEALLAFGPEPLPGAKLTRNLSAEGDLGQAARDLFAHLRDLDAAGVESVAVMPIPNVGLGAAINDRLRRAAAPRSQPTAG